MLFGTGIGGGVDESGDFWEGTAGSGKESFC
jgi:hypothetical protein